VGAIKILEKPSSIFQPLPLLPKSAVYKKEGKMKFPCEIMVWVVLPGIRAAVAEELIKKGLKAQFSAGCEKGDKKKLAGELMHAYFCFQFFVNRVANLRSPTRMCSP